MAEVRSSAGDAAGTVASMECRGQYSQKEITRCDVPTVNLTSVVPPIQQPMIIPSRTARTWLNRFISTNSAFVS